MKRTAQLFALALLAILLVPAGRAQEPDAAKKPEAKQDDTKPEPTQEPAAEVWGPEDERGMIEVGVRGFWGDVYGRPDLPFQPNLRTSKLNEYSDIRNNFLLRRARIHFDNVFGSQNYIDYQSQSAFYRNQSHLATFGRYGKFKLQLRYDEIPHIYTNTARTPYVQTAPGVYTMPLALRQALQTASSTGNNAAINSNLPAFVATQLVPGEQFIVPQIRRRTGSGLFVYNLTPEWNVSAFFAREHESGTRPIGLILNSSPSAGGSSQPGSTSNRQTPGTGVELPEPIDYFNNTVRAMTEYGRRKWVVQFGYNGSFFENNIDSLVFDAPFATADVPVQIIAPGGGCAPSPPAVNCAIGAIPAHGRVDLYPDNHAHYLYFAGALDLGKRVRLMGMVNPGWLRQNDKFLPYTINSAITGLAPLPATSLNGQKQTLAMNWTLVGKVTKNIELEGKYRQYDYNNNTAVFELTPIQGDVIGANATATGQADSALSEDDTAGRSNPGYNRKTLELTGNWFFAKRSSVKLGWEGEWMERSHRDAAHSFEHTFFGALDLSPTRDLLFRISGRHQNREPAVYQDEAASDPVTGDEISCISTSVVFTEEQRCHRRFDEAARILDRADVMVQYDWKQFNFGGSFQTIQQDFNRRGDTNSPTPLNFVAGTTNPYYLYGAIKDLSWTYALDAGYAFSPTMSAFVEYTHENYHKRMISRSRTPTSGVQTILTCAGCDTANNDWESTYRDVFDTYAAGMDFFLWKKVWFSPYYSLAAGKGNVFTRALGDPAILAGPNKFLLTGGSSAQDYPETTTRIHEGAAVFKYKLTKSIMPKIEYRYQQFDNRDYQTSAMTPYMGCIGAGSIVVTPPCVNVGPNLATQFPSPFYPYFVVGDTAAARYLFLGADQPSYHAHILTVALEYHW